MQVLVTGSGGLIGSEVVRAFAQTGRQVIGVDNNMRADFFGPVGDTRWNQQRLAASFSNFHHREIDIRDRAHVLSLLEDVRPDASLLKWAQLFTRAADKILPAECRTVVSTVRNNWDNCSTLGRFTLASRLRLWILEARHEVD